MKSRVDAEKMNEKTGYKRKPAIRFPEFRDEWKSKYLREIAVIISEKAGLEKYILMSVSSGNGLVSQVEKFGREIAGKQYKNYYVIRKNDFAYNKSATKEYPEGFIAMNASEEYAAVPNSIFTCFRLTAEDVSPQYLNFLFLNNFHGKWLKKYITIGARAHGSLNIDDEYLLAMPVPIPSGRLSLREQEKISECLLSLDELIIGQTQKINALRAYKNGLMQQIFPMNRESISKIRFPEFLVAPKWEMCKLGLKTIKIGSGITPRGGESNYVKEGHPFIRSKNIGWGRLLFDDLAYIDNETHNSFIATEIKKGDILLNITGASIGRCAVATADIAGGNVSQHVCIIRLEKTAGIPAFFSQYLLSEHGQHQIDLFQAGGNRQGLNFSQISSLMISCALQNEEQQKVANCLSSFDDLIAAHEEKLNALKRFKKGLMQQLFPEN